MTANVTLLVSLFFMFSELFGSVLVSVTKLKDCISYFL